MFLITPKTHVSHVVVLKNRVIYSFEKNLKRVSITYRDKFYYLIKESLMKAGIGYLKLWVYEHGLIGDAIKHALVKARESRFKKLMLYMKEDHYQSYVNKLFKHRVVGEHLVLYKRC